MSYSFYRGLQSCLEPGRILSLKLAQLKTDFPLSSAKILHFDQEDRKNIPLNDEEEHDGEMKNYSNPEISQRSSLQTITNSTQTDQGINEKIDSNNVYVHPLLKRSSSMLSEKSLETCTESLGSESGSDITETMDDEKLNYQTRENTNKYRQKGVVARIKRNYSFPPPLSSISGSRLVRVKSHREDGRLVLMAIESPSSRSGFHTQRVNGRLKLELFKDGEDGCNYDHGAQEEEEEEEEGEKSDDGLWNELMEEKGKGMEAQIGKEKGKFPRSRGCKEASGGENEGLSIWDTSYYIMS